MRKIFIDNLQRKLHVPFRYKCESKQHLTSYSDFAVVPLDGFAEFFAINFGLDEKTADGSCLPETPSDCTQRCYFEVHQNCFWAQVWFHFQYAFEKFHVSLFLLVGQ